MNLPSIERLLHEEKPQNVPTFLSIERYRFCWESPVSFFLIKTITKVEFFQEKEVYHV